MVNAIEEADAAGVDEVWIADEGVTREPLVVLSAAAVKTTHIRLGIGITTPAIRHPGAIGASMATLDELSGGRAMLGFGVGGHLTLGPFGLSIDKPVRLIRDAIRITRGVMRGESVEGYEKPDHAMPPRDVPIFIASRGEQINTLASKSADGVFLSGVPVDDLERVLGWARSVRPIHAALYPSVRFLPGGDHDLAALRGSPDDVAHAMVGLALTHRPESIGLCMVDDDSLPSMAAKTIEALRRFRLHY